MGTTSAPAENEFIHYLKSYYGKELKNKNDFKQKACCTEETASRFSTILGLIPAEVKERYYGCGCPVPDDNLEGLTILDLGCGAGLDVFLLSYLVGQAGFVYGVDMTQEQLDIAAQFSGQVMQNYGYQRSNIAFIGDFIESAESIADRSIDLVISNCVINLSPRKDLVFKTISRVLKEGGEFYISDIVADRRVPNEIRNDPQMRAECLGGAEYEHDFFDLMKDSGFLDPRTVSRRDVQNEANGIPIAFSSLTIRGFQFEEALDRRCEDYGQIAIYKGTINQHPARLIFDDHHVFESGRPTAVCRNTARMLSETRLREHFSVTDPIRHFGLFACGGPSSEQKKDPGACC